MSDNEINKAIAEYCGWKNVHLYEDDERQAWIGNPPDIPLQNILIPNYCNDLNAMAAAERFLFGGNMHSDTMPPYERILTDILCRDSGSEPHEVWLWHANSKQRAEAFLTVIKEKK